MTFKEKIIDVKNNILDIPEHLIDTFKDVLFQKEKGEAIKVHTRPQTKKEAYAQGYYGVRSNVTLVSVDAFELVINELCGIDKDDPNAFLLTEAMTNIAIGSASTKFRRGDSTSNILQNTRPDVNMANYGYSHNPESVRINDRLNENRDLGR